MLLSTSTTGSVIGHTLPLGRVICFAISSFEWSSLGTNRYTSRALIMFPETSRDSSTWYKTGKTGEVVELLGASLLQRFGRMDSFARVVGTLVRILWRGISVSPIAFLVDL